MVAATWMLALCTAQAIPVTYTGAGGLSAQADFVLSSPSILEITLMNTSTAPYGGGEANMVLSSLNFNLGGATITGGSVALGAGSNVVSKSGGSWAVEATPSLDAEWGYSNTGVGNSPAPVVGAFQSVTAHTNGGGAVTAFDGTPGPLSGGLDFSLVASGSNAFGNSSFILDTLVLTLTLSEDLADLSFLANGSYVEFGSDFLYVPDRPPVIPEPTTLALLGLGLSLAGLRRTTARKKK